MREAAAELDRAERERLVLIIDQSEELFAHPPETVETVTGLLAVLASARRPDGRPLACVVAVVRGDYLDPLLGLPAVLQALGEGRADPESGIRQVLPMSPSELRETIEGPVRRARVVRMEDGLVDRLMRDVRGLSNPITLIAFTMTALWDRQRHGTLTLSGYEEINGVAGALRRHMDRVLDEELTEHEQDEARSLLTSLAIPHGADGYVRRQLPRTGVREEHWRLAQQLAGRRVITLGVAPDGTETMELAHEALLDEWPRLRGWLDADRRFLEWRTDLSMAMAQYEASPDRDAGLLSGALLEEADGWVRERAHDLTEAELEFVAQSHRMQRLGRRIGFGCAGAMVLTVVIAATFVVLWYWGRKDAEATADAEAARANESQALMTGDPALALPSVVAGYRRDVPDAAQRARWLWNSRTDLVQWVRPMSFSLTDAAVFSPDGEHVLYRNSQDEVLLTTLADPALPVVTVARGTSMPGKAFTPDGRFAVYPEAGGDLVFWDVAKKRETRRLPTFGDDGAPVRSIAIAPSGDAVAYARGDEVWIVDGATGRRRDSFRHVPDPLSKQAEELWFDSTGRRLYIWGGAEHSVIDRDSGDRHDLGAHAGEFHTASGSAYVTCENKKIVNGENGEPPSEPDGVARLFDATSGEQIGPAVSLEDSCIGYTFATDSEELFIFHEAQQPGVPSSTSLAVSARESGKAAGEFDVPTARAARAVTETPDGTRLLVDAGDSYYRLLVPRRESMNRALSMARDADITNDGKRVMTLSPEDGLRVWDRATGRGIAAVPPAKACVGGSLLPAVTANADGTRTAALCGRRVTVVDTASGRRIADGTLSEAQGWPKSSKLNHQPRMGLVTRNLLLVEFAGHIMALDLTTGQWNPLPVARYIETYSNWTPRPGHPQIAAGRRDGGGIDILDVRSGGRVATIPAPSGTTNLGLQVRFDPTGRMLASADATRESTTDGAAPSNSLTIWNVDERKKVAEFERKGSVTLTALLRSGNTVAFHTSDFPQGNLSFWREQDSWIPFKGGDHVDGILVKAENIRLSADGAHGIYHDLRGWHFLDPNPDNWMRRLCGLVTKGRLSEPPAKKASGEPACR
ncbi:WD40 repeat domain-containing protein [Actinomadura welshii]|uniref:WD40 repeat domain-containing protein n=1 Tax=Actinomadura welshii TaxID=3103817 RepID=UPI0003AD237F|nr:WD40 repeat domain-containing protein [Actinomadura madurae]